jgi:hypothetical protein
MFSEVLAHVIWTYKNILAVEVCGGGDPYLIADRKQRRGNTGRSQGKTYAPKDTTLMKYLQLGPTSYFSPPLNNAIML